MNPLRFTAGSWKAKAPPGSAGTTGVHGLWLHHPHTAALELSNTAICVQWDVTGIYNQYWTNGICICLCCLCIYINWYSLTIVFNGICNQLYIWHRFDSKSGDTRGQFALLLLGKLMGLPIEQQLWDDIPGAPWRKDILWCPCKAIWVLSDEETVCQAHRSPYRWQCNTKETAITLPFCSKKKVVLGLISMCFLHQSWAPMSFVWK